MPKNGDTPADGRLSCKQYSVLPRLVQPGCQAIQTGEPNVQQRRGGGEPTRQAYDDLRDECMSGVMGGK